MTIEQDAYDRGVQDGHVVTRLDHHDEQIASLVATQARLADIAAGLASTVQTLTEARVTDAATRVATAIAVKEAKDNQEEQARRSWSPLAKMALASGVLVGILGFIWGLFASLPNI
jgi:hypothetical protein